MIKILTLAFLLLGASAANAQTATNTQTATKPDASTDWKPKLVADMVTRFSITEAEANSAIAIKSRLLTVKDYRQLTPVQTPKGLQVNSKSQQELDASELKDMVTLIKDENKAKQIYSYLTGKIPGLSGGGRPR
ncbi:MAG: hypothetical protein JWQ96_2479 [Segetibacter sp.]|nr:hypothetical protein [Segetibacter sp.]